MIRCQFKKIITLAIVGICLLGCEITSKSWQQKIGDSFAGGIVFFIDNDGYGLVAAVEDATESELVITLGGSFAWGTNELYSTHTRQSGTGYGEIHTPAIIEKLGEGAYAAWLCSEYINEDYSDWFLPSADELLLMYENLHLAGLGDFLDGRYWSSTEETNQKAVAVYFKTGATMYTAKTETARIRPVRSFAADPLSM